jgi:hypothetical protein
VKVYRDTQPNQVVRINWDNPIARGLVFACVGGVPVDLVSGATPDTNTSTITSTNLGQMQVTSTATPLVIPRTHRARPKSTGEITMFVYGQNQVDTAWPRMAQIRDNDNTSLVFLEQENGYSYWGIHNIGGGNDFPGYSAPSYGKAATGIGVPYKFAMSMRENYFFRSFFNGNLIFEDTLGTYNFFVDDDLTTNVTWANGTGTFGNYLTLIWNRALTAGEHAVLNANPWQLFESDRKPTVYLPPLVTTTTKQWHATPLPSPPPNKAAPIDWDNQITRKLLAAGITDISATGQMRNMVVPTMNPTEGGFGYVAGSSIRGTDQGPALFFGSGGYVRGFSWYEALGNEPDLTSLVLFIPLNTTTTNTLHSIGGPSFERPSWIGLEAGGVVKGVQGNDTAGSTITHQNAALVGRVNCAIYRNRHKTDGSAFQDLWLNGVPSSTTGASSAQSGFTGTGMSLGSAGNEADTLGFLLFATWGRVITTGEARSLSANPWQIFKADSRVAWFDHGTLYPTLSVAELISVLATQATPRVTIDWP